MALLSTCTLNFVCSKCSGIVVHSSRRSSAVLHQFRDGNDYKHIMVSGSNDVLRRLRLQAPQRLQELAEADERGLQLQVLLLQALLAPPEHLLLRARACLHPSAELDAAAHCSVVPLTLTVLRCLRLPCIRKIHKTVSRTNL